MYIYGDHMGGLYTSDRELSYEERHCKVCGDTDWLLGYADTKEEAWCLLKDDMCIDDNGSGDHEYIKAFIAANWED